MASRPLSSTIRRERIRNQVVLAILLVAAMLAFAWFVLGGGESSGVASGDPVILAQADGDADPGTDGASEPVPVDVTYDVFLERDPFESIRPEEPEDTSSGDDGQSTNGDGTNGNGGDGGSGDGGSGNGDGGNGGDTKDPVDGTVTITVLDVTVSGAVIRVGSNVYTPLLGDVFADDLRLVRIIGDCVEIQRGDRVLPVLCAGEAVVK